MKSCYDFQFKIITLGDPGVGKTSIIRRYSDDEFEENYCSTIGIDVKTKLLEIDEQKIRLQIWDTAGQDKFRTISKTYYRGARGIALVFACNDEKSLNSLKSWMKQIEAYSDDSTVKILIGNKTDTWKRVISNEQGKWVAEEYNIQYFETSAKTGENIDIAFFFLAQEMLKRQLDKNIIIPMDERNGLYIDEPRPKEEKVCCNI